MLGSPLGSILDGKYRLVRELSRGGMGAVYAATHQHLGTEVAVKLLHAASGAGSLASSSPATRQRQFLREARLAAQLRHPGIVQVLDFGISGDVPYLVMELVPGESLRQHLTRHGRLPLPEVLAVVEGVSAALAVAHARGVVHRDLKPENIVIDASGERLGVKVVDFGLATMSPEPATAAAGVASARDPEVSGSSLVPVMAGTPAYLSPEQASGQGPVTAASDLWALGVIAFECLTGQRPFPGEALGELILQICAWAPPVPSALAEVPDGFDAWFSSACARAPSDRFSSAPAMAAALAGLLRGSSPALAPNLEPGLAPGLAPWPHDP